MATVRDLKRQGKEGLEIYCSGCGWTVVHWWGTLGAPDDADLDRLISRLRCKRCRCRPKPLDVRPYNQSDAYARMGLGHPR